jgi:hypothetical protein
MRCLTDDQQCSRCNCVVPDLLQLRDDFVLPGNISSGPGQWPPRLAPNAVPVSRASSSQPIHQAPAESVKQMDWPVSTTTHPRAAANELPQRSPPPASPTMDGCFGSAAPMQRAYLDYSDLRCSKLDTKATSSRVDRNACVNYSRACDLAQAIISPCEQCAGLRRLERPSGPAACSSRPGE